MSKVYLVDGSTMDALADAIQEKSGTTSKLTPAQMIEAAKGISVGVTLPDAEETTFGYVKVTETVTEKAPEGKCWYNGVLLPELPDDVLASYPYAWIRKHTTNGVYQLMLSASGFFYETGGVMVDKGSVVNPQYTFPIGESTATTWTNANNTTYYRWTVDDARPCMWSNHDIPNGSATATVIYFEGSEPITEVTETVTKDVPVEREDNYSITDDSLNAIAKRTQEMAGTNKLLTPADIIYWLGRVQFVPQGWASSEFTLDFAPSTASGILPTVYKGAASSEFTLNFESSAVGALSEEG